MTTVARRDRRQAELAQRRDVRRGKSRTPAGGSLLIPLTLVTIVVIGVAVIALAVLRQDMPSTEGLYAPTVKTAYSLADGHALGPASAPVTVEVWSDYQCPYCQRFATSFEISLANDYATAGKVRIVHRDYAFIGPESIDASIAARCAEAQGSYWQYHDYLFANQNGENKGWFSSARLQGIAQEVGLDLSAFNTCRANPQTRQQVVDETTQGRARGVSSTPTLQIAGTLRTDIKTYADLRAAVEAELAKVAQ